MTLTLTIDTTNKDKDNQSQVDTKALQMSLPSLINANTDLFFYDLEDLEDADTLEEVYALGTDAKDKAREISLNDLKLKIQLLKAELSHEMFKPAMFAATLNISVADTDNVRDKFSREYIITLLQDLYKSGVTIDIANDGRCFNLNIYDMKHKYYVNSDETSLQVSFVAYSADYALTLNKHSQAFTGKTISEIITASAGRFDSVDVASKSLSNLSYEVTNEEEETTTHEFRLPYIVQYQESSYDVLSRTARRYGEFLYWDCMENKLTIGLDPTTTRCTDTPDSEEYSNCAFDTFREQIHNDYRTRTIRSNSQEDAIVQAFNSLISVNTRRIEGVSDITSSVVSNEEYFSANNFKGGADEYTSSDDYLVPTKVYPSLMMTALNSATITLGITATLIKFTLQKLGFRTVALEANEAFDEQKDSANPESDSSLVYSDYLTTLNTTLTNLMELCAEYGSSNSVELDYGCDTGVDAAVGRSIELSDGKLYLITSYNYMADTTDSTCSLKARAIPAVSNDSSNFFYPEKSDQPLYREAKTQMAKVVDDLDPSALYRVRVRYAWQIVEDEYEAQEQAWQDSIAPADDDTDPDDTDPDNTDPDDTDTDNTDTESTDSEDSSSAEEPAGSTFFSKLTDATPWIRVSSAVASTSGAAMNFLPTNGDEVIINFEDGNIERPFVSGVVYSSSVPPGFGNAANHYKVLKSTNGHSLMFYDNPNPTEFLANMVPVFGIVQSIINTNLIPYNTNTSKLAGYTMLCDSAGMYSVKLSTDDRKISISSPFGSVGIDAYTGISISAPMGNIAIKGKNISLEAGNNISLITGTNIKNHIWKNKLESLKSTPIVVAKVVMGTVLDLGFIRTVWETFFRPVDGKLLIKSHRNVLIEAGAGMANGKVLNNEVDNNADLKPHVDNLSLMSSTLCGLRTSYKQKTKKAEKLAKSYITMRARLAEDPIIGLANAASINANNINDYLPTLENTQASIDNINAGNRENITNEINGEQPGGSTPQDWSKRKIFLNKVLKAMNILQDLNDNYKTDAIITACTQNVNNNVTNFIKNGDALMDRAKCVMEGTSSQAKEAYLTIMIRFANDDAANQVSASYTALGLDNNNITINDEEIAVGEVANNVGKDNRNLTTALPNITNAIVADYVYKSPNKEYGLKVADAIGSEFVGIYNSTKDFFSGADNASGPGAILLSSSPMSTSKFNDIDGTWAAKCDHSTTIAKLLNIPFK